MGMFSNIIQYYTSLLTLFKFTLFLFSILRSHHAVMHIMLYKTFMFKKLGCVQWV